MNIIDSHAHLDYDYDVSTEQLVSDAKSVGVDHIITIAAEASSLARVVEIASRFDNVFHSAGIHPHDAADLDDQVYSEIVKCASSEKCVAIGELGLDYFYDHSSPEEQLPALRRQLDFSLECAKPIIVHSRDAEADTISELTKHASAWAKKYPSKAPGVIHCFTGSSTLARECLKLGYFISFSGIITFKNAQDLRQTLQEDVPVEKLLVETDSPYLAPVPYRGKKNRPQYTKEVAEKVAEIKGISFEDLAKITRANTIKLFNLPIN